MGGKVSLAYIGIGSLEPQGLAPNGVCSGNFQARYIQAQNLCETAQETWAVHKVQFWWRSPPGLTTSILYGEVLGKI
jgi:hypothetical protein